MLKSKVKSLQKEFNRISRFTTNKVYLVDVEVVEYIIWCDGKEMLRCNQVEFDDFEQKRPGSIFIINDIPDGRNDELEQ